MNGLYGTLGKTSAAAPHVSGLAGLIRSINPNLTRGQVRIILRATADKVPAMGGANYTPEYGHGRINAYAALKYTLENYGGTLSGEVLLTENLTIATGKTLTIAAGSTIKFDSGVKLTIDGTLNAQGTSQDPITFTASGTSWHGLYFAAGSSGSLEYCTLDKLSGGAGSGAVTINGNTAVAIENSTIDVLAGSYVFGVYASGSSSSANDVTIYKSTVRSASGPALYVSGSGGYVKVHESEIVQNSSSETVRVPGGTVEFWRWPTNYDGKNKIKGGKLYASSNALIDAGDYWDHDKNHFCDAAGATLQVASGGTIYARYDYWPNGNPPTQINNGGYIHYSNNLGSSDCSGVSAIVSEKTVETIVSDGQTDMESLLFEAKKKVREGLFAEAIVLFSQIVASGHLPEAPTALLELRRLYKKTQIADIGPIVQQASNQPGVLKATAMKVLADIYGMQNKQSQALTLLDDIVQLYPGTSEAFSAQIEKFLLHFSSGDFKSATQVLDAIKPGNQEEELDVMAARQLLNLETGATAFSSQTLGTQNQERVETKSELAAGTIAVSTYPNPFNPTSTLHYNLPDDGEVDIRIFNSKGQEIELLERGFRQAGEYQVEWNGRENNGVTVGSGVYFYTLTFRPVDGNRQTIRKSGILTLIK